MAVNPVSTGAPATGAQDDADTYTVKPGDTLWAIAKREYGDPTKWTLIRDANPDSVKMRDANTAIIHPGDKLIIPPKPDGTKPGGFLDDSGFQGAGKTPPANGKSAPPTNGAPAAAAPKTSPQLKAAEASLNKSPVFKNLDADTQKQVKDLMQQNAAHPRVLQNIAHLATSEGFGQLPVAARGVALNALMKNPTDATYEADLQEAISSPDFQNLNDESKTQILRSMKRFATDPQARRTFVKLAEEPGFKLLSNEEKSKLLNYVGGTNVEISGPARSALATALATGPKDPGQQVAMLRKFMTDQSSAEQVLDPPLGTFTGKGVPYKVNQPPQEVKSYPFRSGSAAALKYDVEVGGKHIPVYMPKTPDPAKGDLPSIDAVAQGLASIPAASRALVTQVSVNPDHNPGDADLQKRLEKAHQPVARSYMSCGADGKVDVYPTTTPQSQDFLDGSLIHETGHALAMSKWGNDPQGAKWAPWRAAIAKDGISVSKYANLNPNEDFAESLKMYFMVKGTPQEAEMRKLMPERFKILDQLVGGGN